MFGSGKSTFGTNGINFLHDRDVIQVLHHPPSAANVPKDLKNMCAKNYFTQELVDKYLNVRTVYVDLKMGSPSIAFEEALFHACGH